LADERAYGVEIIRAFDPRDLSTPDSDEVENGEEDGLAGNQQYRDLRDVDWEDVEGVLACEAAAFTRFAEADDLDQAAELFDEERLELVEPDDLWGLDVGVAGAALTLAALGAIPVSSCNAGGFGGHYVARFPYVAFFIGVADPATVLALAAEADVGLDVVDPGLGRLYGTGDRDLHRFAALALRRHSEAK
jgi:hypothetical protein